MTHTAQTPGNGPDRATLIMAAVLLSEDTWTDDGFWLTCRVGGELTSARADRAGGIPSTIESIHRP